MLTQKIKSLLSPFKKAPSQPSVDQLKRERIRLDRLLNKSQDEISTVEVQKGELFKRGQAVTSRRERESLARQIKRLDSNSKHQHRCVHVLSKQLSVLDGLICVRENAAMVKQMASGSVLNGMPTGDLARLIEESNVEGAFELEKVEEMAQLFEDGSTHGEYELEGDIKSIVDAMEDASPLAEALGNACSEYPVPSHAAEAQHMEAI